MSEGTKTRKISKEDVAAFREMLNTFLSSSFSRISETAESVAQLPDSAEYIQTFLSSIRISEDDADIEAWKISALYFISMLMFYNEYSEENEKQGINENITFAFMNLVLDANFIWSKIKHLYPNFQDNTDGTANPDGLAIATGMIEKWVTSAMSHEDRFSNLAALVHSITETEQNKAENDIGTREYRTRKKAGGIIPLPSYLATITLPNWEYGVSLLSDGNAHLEPIQAFVADRLQFEDGVLYFENSNGQKEEFTEAHLRKGMTKEGIDKINLPLLRFYYSTILKCLETNLRDLRRKGNNNDEAIRQTLTFMPVTFYLPELIERLDGGKGNFNQEKAMKLIRETSAFRHIIGVIYDYKGRESYYPVLNFRGYNVANNTISFESPYLSYLALEIYDNSIKRNKGGKPIAKKNGAPALLPSHSYLIKPSIATERNKDAALNAMNIVTLIEQAGGEDAHISALELIRRNPVFEERLQRSANKRQLLSRTFKKTWELLRSQTRLEEVYKDINLPSPDDAASIPTQSSMESLVFTFTHKGKSKS